ncbi:MAG: DUF975 family protein [Gammaproteobacteria bacterium]|nr:DUF975 family protein [Gammaproteobacteria bacterium]MBU1483079.1 DUF975 family protein [Gammaproteobacteria bacterium]
MNVISNTENRILMEQALESLKGKWGLAIGAWIVVTLINVGTQAFGDVGALVSIVIAGPITLGWVGFVLALSRNQNPKFGQIFDGFNRFGTALGAYLLVLLFIFLWMLLLIIPGIIAGLSYSQTFYILSEDPSIGAMDAIKKSKEMMYGNRWKLFCLGLRFIGWLLLCIPTLGIGFIWLAPYMAVSMAKFYDDLAHGTSASAPVTD